MDLKIRDVADLLHVSETTIRRWLADGKIPAYRIGGQFRFSRQEIESWVLKQKQGRMGVSPFEESEGEILPDQSNKQPNVGSKQFSLYRAIHKGGVLNQVPGHSKEEVIRNTTKIIARDINLDADVLSELLLDRERMQPTALNHGIGIPHTRDFLLKEHQDIVTVVFPEHPLVYGALDGKPVHTLFFLFACDDKRHLNLLAKIAHLSSQQQAQDLFKQKPSKENFLEYIRNWEGSLQPGLNRG